MTTLPPLGHRLEMAFGRDCPTVWIPGKFLVPTLRPFTSMQNMGAAAIVAFRFNSHQTSLLLAQYADDFLETKTTVVVSGRRRVRLDQAPTNLLFEASLQATGASTRELTHLDPKRLDGTELSMLPIAAGFNFDYIGPFYPEDRTGSFELLLPSEYHPYKS